MNKRLITKLTIAALLLMSTSLAAQYTREYNPFIVTSDSDTLKHPFWGGCNNPKPTLVDLDGDGLTDLIIGKPDGGLTYFNNQGSPSAPVWVPVTDRLAGIDFGTWHLFCDIDGDGDLDLFCDNKLAGVAYYRNDAPGYLPEFSLIDSAYWNFQTGINNTPGFADIDSDGDQDFFFGALGGNLEFYRNDGDSANASYVFVTAHYDSILAYPGGGGVGVDGGPRHGFSNIRFTDIDADNDFDLFFGDIYNSSLYFFSNEGTPVTSDLTLATETYLQNPTAGFNHPTFADLDGDGDPDMLVGVVNSSVIDNLRFLRNTGSPQLPNFIEEELNYIEGIDVGSRSFPALGDLDQDGDLDLLVGGSSGGMTYYENVGDRLTAEFLKTSDLYAGIDVGWAAAPQLVDIDSDNDLDLLIGTSSGEIEFWRNVGTAWSPAFVLEDPQFAGVSVDQLAVPLIADLDGDGLLDMVVGEWDYNSAANVLAYRNVGSVTAPEMVLQHSALLPIRFREYTIPEIYDWDNDGRPDLIIGGRLSGLTLYRNTTGLGLFPDSTTMILQPDTIPGYDLGHRTVIRFADIDIDGDYDAFIGEDDGGLNFFRRDGSCCVGIRGNVNADSADGVDVSDLGYMVDYLFGPITSLECIQESNVNGSPNEGVDVSDLTYIVEYLFRGGPPPPACPEQ